MRSLSFKKIAWCQNVYILLANTGEATSYVTFHVACHHFKLFSVNKSLTFRKELNLECVFRKYKLPSAGLFVSLENPVGGIRSDRCMWVTALR